MSKKLSHKNSIKLKKGNPLDFLSTPSTPSKEFGQNPKDFQLLCIDDPTSTFWAKNKASQSPTKANMERPLTL